MLHGKTKAALLFSAFLLGCIPAWAASTYETGMKHYTAGRYERAVIYFSLAEEEQPRNALIHYYLADALARSGHHDQAIVEYGICYKLSPNGQVANYCKQALSGYKQPLPVKHNSVARTAGGANRFDGSGRLIGSNDEEELIARTKSHIRQEVIYEKSKHQQMGDLYASGAMSRAELEARLIQEEAAREIDQATQPQLMLVGRSLRYVAPDPEVARVKVEEIKRLAQEKSEGARKTGLEKADRYKEWSRDRQNSLDEVVANIESQLEQKGGNSGVQLQPVGTDLYTRYYGTLRASTQLPDVKQAVVRIIAHPGGLRGNEESLPPTSDQSESVRVQKVVRGSVLH